MIQSITEENLKEELVAFFHNLEITGLLDYFDTDKLKNSLSTASCALSEDTGCGYPGSLVVHINLLTALALRLRKMICATFPIEEETIIKVCTLMHLSKIQMYVPNDNQWEIEKRGMNFKFADLNGKLKFGERSILNAMNLGIKLSAEEFEAMKCLDNEKDGVSKFGDSILTTIIRQANELAYAIEKERYNKLVKEIS